MDTQTLSDADRALMERFIGIDSKRHGEYFLRSVMDDRYSVQRELWYLIDSVLGKSEAEAVQRLGEGWKLTAEEARAVWMFVNQYPYTCLAFLRHHTFGGSYSQFAATLGDLIQTSDPAVELALQAG